MLEPAVLYISNFHLYDAPEGSCKKHRRRVAQKVLLYGLRKSTAEGSRKTIAGRIAKKALTDVPRKQGAD